MGESHKLIWTYSLTQDRWKAWPKVKGKAPAAKLLDNDDQPEDVVGTGFFKTVGQGRKKDDFTRLIIRGSTRLRA